MTEPQQERPRWPGFKYEPVRDLMGRHISRYLRIQRKNMRRFFTERGIFDLAQRLDVIRKDSAMGMLEKNRKFQEILNEYSHRTSPTAISETDHQQDSGSSVVGVSATSRTDAGSDSDSGSRRITDGGVPGLAGEDNSGFVIEE